jgi:hypothetical protein
MSKQIYASYIAVDSKILSCLALEMSTHSTVVINFYHFHILIALTKKQNHLMSSLDNSFFNELSLFKDKLFFVFQYNTNELVPMYVIYQCSSKKTSIALKKKILKIFDKNGVYIKESKQPKNAENTFTKFSFE